VLAAVLYIMVINIGGGGPQPPRGAWGAMKVIDWNTVSIDFAEVTPDQAPMDLKILLMRNDTTEGTYSFTSNEDGALSLSSGADVGALAYSDLANNRKISIGDKIIMTDLAPGSEYEIIMIWVHNGDSIASATFSTPG
ncbi:MAG: hypothetical protein KAW09_01860, partial [Thermoplasmata archaeon]|nr:hypothetical protein [Thermoplasmata archaeon]